MGGSEALPHPELAGCGEGGCQYPPKTQGFFGVCRAKKELRSLSWRSLGWAKGVVCMPPELCMPIYVRSFLSWIQNKFWSVP